MSRDINLLNPALRPRKQVLTPGRVALAASVSVAAVLAATGWEHYRLTLAERERGRLSGELRGLQVEVNRVAGQVPSTASPALIEEQARLQRDVDARRVVAERLAGGDFGNTEGFSRYLLALSRQAVPGLWITGFGVGGAGSDLSIRGRVMRSDLVSDYLQRLSGDEALRGRPLAGLSLRAVDIVAGGAEPAAPAGDASGTAKPAPTVRVVEFVLGAAVTQPPRAGERP